jgi:hypothetical protein
MRLTNTCRPPRDLSMLLGAHPACMVDPESPLSLLSRQARLPAQTKIGRPVILSMRTLATPVDSGRCRRWEVEWRRISVVTGVLAAARVAAQCLSLDERDARPG